jgi:hypothetical protein
MDRAKLKHNMRDPESRAFWEGLEARVSVVAASLADRFLLADMGT